MGNLGAVLKDLGVRKRIFKIKYLLCVPGIVLRTEDTMVTNTDMVSALKEVL